MFVSKRESPRKEETLILKIKEIKNILLATSHINHRTAFYTNYHATSVLTIMLRSVLSYYVRSNYHAIKFLKRITKKIRNVNT